MELEWFRPTEVDWYTDVQASGGITHQNPMSVRLQQVVRRAYYSAITHVDDQVGRLLQALNASGADDNTVIIFTADHGQNLGEGNMW